MIKRFAASLALVVVMIVVAEFALVRILWGDTFAGHAGKHIRFGPNSHGDGEVGRSVAEFARIQSQSVAEFARVQCPCARAEFWRIQLPARSLLVAEYARALFFRDGLADLVG